MKQRILRAAVVLMVMGLSLSACNGGDDEPAARDTAKGERAAAPSSGTRGTRGGTAGSAADRERTGTLGGTTPKPEVKRDVRDFRIGTGTALELRNSVEINSRNNRTGNAVTATAARAVYSARGDTVIPAGAEFVGRVIALAPAERPGLEGTMRIDFDSVRLNGRTLAIGSRVTSMASITKGRGVTAGDAAKVGAGAVIGGVAGRVIGGDRRGTIIGAATGAAAGAVIAHNTRDIDIVLPVGAAVQIALTRSFDAGRAYAARNR